MAATRHPILYDLLPWRRYRLRLGIAVIAAYASSAALRVWAPGHADWPNVAGLVGVVCLGVFIGMWLRAALSHARVEPEGIVIRTGPWRYTVEPTAVQTVRVATLATILVRSERYQSRPLEERWSSVAAVSLRLDPSSAALTRLARRAGGRLIYRDEVVLPVADANEFKKELVASLGKRVLATTAKAAVKKRRTS